MNLDHLENVCVFFALELPCDIIVVLELVAFIHLFGRALSHYFLFFVLQLFHLVHFFGCCGLVTR